jgi:NAD(P)H-hydrate epimerase
MPPSDPPAPQGPRFADREPPDHAHPRPTPAYPLFQLTVDAVRRLDHLAVTRHHVPSIVLMENAARALRDHALELLAQARRPDALILCGPGNNAGDGLALARHLANFGVPVRIVLAAGDELSPDAALNLRIARSMSIPETDPNAALAHPDDPPGLIVDALFGTGLSRPVSGPAADLIEGTHAARARGSLVLAVDVPSGLDATTGEPVGGPHAPCVRADRTLTLAAVKPGLTRLEAQPFVGDLAVADIGAPAALLAELGVPWRGFPGHAEPQSGV